MARALERRCFAARFPLVAPITLFQPGGLKEGDGKATGGRSSLPGPKGGPRIPRNSRPRPRTRKPPARRPEPRNRTRRGGASGRTRPYAPRPRPKPLHSHSGMPRPPGPPSMPPTCQRTNLRGGGSQPPPMPLARTFRRRSRPRKQAAQPFALDVQAFRQNAFRLPSLRRKRLLRRKRHQSQLHRKLLIRNHNRRKR